MRSWDIRSRSAELAVSVNVAVAVYVPAFAGQRHHVVPNKRRNPH